MAPSPTVESMPSTPRIASTSFDASARPSPVPGIVVRSAPSRSKGWNSRLRSCGLMPGPVSLTAMRTRWSPERVALTSMRASSPEYFTALESRFSSTWVSRCRSATTWSPGAPERSMTILVRRSMAAGVTRRTASSTTSAMDTESMASISRPLSMRAMSSTSLTRLSRCPLASWMAAMASLWSVRGSRSSSRSL